VDITVTENGLSNGSGAELPDCSWFNIPKWKNIYQLTANIANCQKLNPMALKYPNGHNIY
jgi:hypothetical protein